MCVNVYFLSPYTECVNLYPCPVCAIPQQSTQRYTHVLFYCIKTFRQRFDLLDQGTPKLMQLDSFVSVRRNSHFLPSFWRNQCEKHISYIQFLLPRLKEKFKFVGDVDLTSLKSNNMICLRLIF